MLSAAIAAVPTPQAPGLDPAWIAALVALISAIGGLTAWGIRVLYRILRQLIHFSDDWKGQPEHDGLPARPGVMARLSSVEELLERVHAETQADHGTSLRDVVNRTAADVTGIKQEQQAVRADLDKVKAQHAGPMENH